MWWDKQAHTQKPTPKSRESPSPVPIIVVTCCLLSGLVAVFKAATRYRIPSCSPCWFYLWGSESLCLTFSPAGDSCLTSHLTPPALGESETLIHWADTDNFDRKRRRNLWSFKDLQVRLLGSLVITSCASILPLHVMGAWDFPWGTHSILKGLSSHIRQFFLFSYDLGPVTHLNELQVPHL